MPKKATITHADVRMYRLGTGDCFVIKFRAGSDVTFKMMIDCGAWQGSKEKLSEYVSDLKEHVDNRVDLLVVTHEHKDHVLGFELCEELFTKNFEVGQTWMAWTEEDGDPFVEDWKKKDGLKKKALAAAAQQFEQALNGPNFKTGAGGLAAHQRFAGVLREFTDLQMAVNLGVYAGPLKGMKVVKEKVALGTDGKQNIKYRKPGDIIENIPGLEGVRIYVLGPPQSLDAIHKEDSGVKGETYEHNKESAKGKAEDSGVKGETYEHSKELAKSNAFALAANALVSGPSAASVLPFDEEFEAVPNEINEQAYLDQRNDWRRIDYDWLMSAGSLALRLNSGINNLSLALAIEFVGSGRVMLFPGDAEYGSWNSWHGIPWTEKGRGKNADGSPKHLTEDLLNRTVFYKVAHHLSHNGTARRKGLDHMIDKNLTAMATLDYGVISKSWTGTMPNQGLLEDLLTKTKGRLMVMRTDKVFYDARKTVPLAPKIEKARAEMSSTEAKAFKSAHKPPNDDDLSINFSVSA